MVVMVYPCTYNFFYSPHIEIKTKTKTRRKLNKVAMDRTDQTTRTPVPFKGCVTGCVRFASATEQEIEQAFQYPDGPSKPMNDWLPMFTGDHISPLASLSSCYLNLEHGCDLHREERSREYLEHWRIPAPTWCQGARWDRPTAPRPVRLDRLGIPLSVFQKIG